MKKILKLLSIVIMLTVATIYTMPTKVMAFGPSSDEIYNGIDVSGYQGNIDFGKVKKDGIQVVYIRSSEGTNYIDSKFEQNYKRARDAGLKIGFYHYVTARSVKIIAIFLFIVIFLSKSNFAVLHFSAAR